MSSSRRSLARLTSSLPLSGRRTVACSSVQIPPLSLSSPRAAPSSHTTPRRAVHRSSFSSRAFQHQDHKPIAAQTSPDSSDFKGPLHGITVVSLEQAIAAPLCSRHLADLGARVIKVERPGVGDFARAYDTRAAGLCSHFTWVNRSKESLALDLKDPKDLAVLKKLCEKVDVLVQNLAPGASERLGLGYEELRKKNEGIVVADISGYGSYGPYVKKKAYDLLIQAEAGFLTVTGTDDGTPVKAGNSIADISAGMYAFSNILAALYKRRDTGKGCRLDVSMLETMGEWMLFPMYYAYEGQKPPKAAGAEHASIYPYGPFNTGGQGVVMLGIQNEREWKNLCEQVLERPDLLHEERFAGSTPRSENRDALRPIIEEVFAKMSADQVVERLEEAQIANAKVNDMDGLWDHPQLKARDRFTTVDSPVGSIRTLKPPAQPLDWPVRMDPIPKVGEHNEKILAELGFG